MSELKVYEAYICSHEFLPEEAPKDCEAIVSSNSRYAKDDWWDNAKEFECYLKAEADKVIAHHKYKRCLAMARWCEATALWCYQAANTLPTGFKATLFGKPVMIETDRLYNRFERLMKWSNRWFKIAEQFKEAK